jgi:penicillin-binding protein 2
MRLSALAIVVLSLVGALTARLWYLTVVEGDESVDATLANSTRTIHIQAPRGRIFDRHYQMLVDNKQVRQLRVDEHELDVAVAYEHDDRDQVFQRVAAALNRFEVPVEAGDVVAGARLYEREDGGSDAEVIRAGEVAELTADEVTTWNVQIVRGALESNRSSPFVPTPVANDVPEDLEVLLAENQQMYPGVQVEPVAVRYYPHGTLAAHLLGYVKSITEDELAAHEDEDDKPYAAGDDIGKSGVELAYEEYLRGVPGERVIEVDAHNNPVRTISYRPPVPGYDLMLEMDVRAQALLELALHDQAEANAAPGAAGVVMDPTSGGIIAMASYPTYDPVELSGRVSDQRFRELTNPEDGATPLNNRAISGQYFPGSTFKPVTALAGLRAGVVTPDFAWADTGTYTIEGCEGDGCTVQNAGEVANGTVQMAGSLTLSSDTYYYRIGDQLWGARDRAGEDAIQRTANEFGFGEDTDLDLPSASSGFIWTPEFLTEHCTEDPELCTDGADQRWRTGDNVNLSIGQGYIGVTPIQLTNMYAVLANGGALHTPHVGRMVLERDPDTDSWNEILRIAPDDLGHVTIRPQWRDTFLQGLLGVPQGGGTASGAFEGFDLAGYPIAGKTGTSQKVGEEDSALFVGFGPVRNGRVPEPSQEASYVVSTVLEEVGQFGGTVAAPAVRQVFDGLRDSAYFPQVPCSYLATPVAATQPSECPEDGTVPDYGTVTPPPEDEG